MTDTAIPMPDVVSGELSPEQKRRGSALDVARSALISRVGLFGGSNLPTAFGVADLIAVAEWVLGPYPTLIEPLDLTAAGGWESGPSSLPEESLLGSHNPLVAGEGLAWKSNDDTEILPPLDPGPAPE